MNTAGLNRVGFPSVSGASRRLGNNVWLISFGDLLTLLLCTFVAIVSLSRAQYKAEIAAKHANLESKDLANRGSIGPVSPRASAGTQVAQNTMGGSVQSQAEDPASAAPKHALVAADFASNSVSLQAEAKQKLLAALVQAAGFEEVRIEACAESAVSEQAWFWAMGRVLQISSELQKQGVAAQQMQLRVVGDDCKLLRTSPQDAEAVARVSFVSEKVSPK